MSGSGLALKARQDGAKYYLTNRPCPRGHDPIRYAANRSCCECNDTRADARHVAKRGEKADAISIEPRRVGTAAA
jgi:hypothetical protein